MPYYRRYGEGAISIADPTPWSHHLRLGWNIHGAMHTWVGAILIPVLRMHLCPGKSPVEIAGQNRVQRKWIMDAIKMTLGGRMEIMTSSSWPDLRHFIPFSYGEAVRSSGRRTRRHGRTQKRFLQSQIDRYRSSLDANYMIYQFEASRFYNPSKHSRKITALCLLLILPTTR